MNHLHQQISGQRQGKSQGSGGYSQEQIEALKRQYSQSQAAGGGSSSSNQNTATANSNGSSGSNGNSPYMVLTQVQVPSHLMGQLSKQQIAQLQQQQQQQQGQQQQGGSKSSSANQSQQVMSLSQLPPEFQQQVLLQQQQQMQQQGQRSSQQDIQSQLQQQLRQQLQQQQMQQQQQPGNSFGSMGMNDLQQLIKSNGGELNANLMQQVVSHQQQQQQGGNQNSNNNNSFSNFFNDYNDASDKDSSSDVSNSNKRIFLETQVQPVQRQGNSGGGGYGDDDLLKFFQTELGDDSGHGGDDFNDGGNDAFNGYSFLEPTPLFQQQQQQQAASSQPQTNNVSIAPPGSSSSSHKQQSLPNQVSSNQQQQYSQQMVNQASSSTLGGGGNASSAQNNNNNNSFVGGDQILLLPSTMVPPTVLASVCKGTSTKRAAPAKKKPASKKAKRMDTSQDVLQRLVEKQGHNLQRIKSEDAGYDTMPSPLQLSSFGTQVVHAVHTNDDEMLGQLLSCGLSPNPCNQFRDSILDLVCKRSNVAIFNCLLEHGADLRVVDGFGRTPLHHCAWASEFCKEIAEAILERDPLQLFIEDKRGQTPMEYIRPSLMTDWSEFLEENVDKFWPKGGTPTTLVRPKDSRPDGTLPDPENAVSPGLAAAISSGKITPEQFANLDEATIKSYG